MTSKEAKKLIERYHLGKSAPGEAEALNTWFNQLVQESIVDLTSKDKAIYKKRMLENIHSRISSDAKQSYKVWPLVTGIAASVILITIGSYIFMNTLQKKQTHELLNTTNIRPGKNAATLTLADGKKIRLSDVKTGEIAQQSGISINKTLNGEVVYNRSTKAGIGNQFNTLTTEKGETYMLTLPDQSKVWLNAASSLTFNTSLLINGVRKVKLTGEAYFEVAKNRLHPFIVESGSQQVEVLGTHFNVNAYADEKVYKTTLVEGSVKVSDQGISKILLPGIQAINSSNGIQLIKVNTALSIAWKNNNFIFDRLEIKEIMRMIERWYDVDVVYIGETPHDKFWGSVSRFDHISKVLIPLEATGKVQFKIEGRKITVTR